MSPLSLVVVVLLLAPLLNAEAPSDDVALSSPLSGPAAIAAASAQEAALLQLATQIEKSSSRTASSLAAWRKKKKRRAGEPKMKCFFIHGAGTDSGLSGTATKVVNDMPSYWGQMANLVKDACQPSFVEYDAINNGWDNAALLEAICKEIQKVGPHVVISHSMGNLIYAAMLSGKAASSTPTCASLKFASTYNSPAASEIHWISLAGPFLGSELANVCAKLCVTDDFLWLPVADTKMGCNCKDRKLRASDASLVTTYDGQNGLSFSAISQETPKAYAQLCGISMTSPTVPSVNWVVFKFLKFLEEIRKPHLYGPDHETHNPPNTSGNDGLVSFTSCRGANAVPPFKEDPAERFYAAKLNHQASTYVDGDGSEKSEQVGKFVLDHLKSLAQLLSLA